MKYCLPLENITLFSVSCHFNCITQSHITKHQQALGTHNCSPFKNPALSISPFLGGAATYPAVIVIP